MAKKDKEKRPEQSRMSHIRRARSGAGRGRYDRPKRFHGPTKSVARFAVVEGFNEVGGVKIPVYTRKFVAGLPLCTLTNGVEVPYEFKITRSFPRGEHFDRSGARLVLADRKEVEPKNMSIGEVMKAVAGAMLVSDLDSAASDHVIFS